MLGPAQPLWADSRPRIIQFNELVALQKYEEALSIIREEIADPQLDDTVYRASLHIVAISGLGKYANLHGWTDAMDREARDYFDKGRRIAADNEQLQAGLLHALYSYYSTTNRNGLALPLIRQEIEYWKKVGNQYQVMIALDGMASVFDDAGELEAAAHYAAEAMAIGEDYFVIGKHPQDQNEWLNYSSILDKRAEDALDSGDAERLGIDLAPAEGTD